jgi:hypothetical protein
MDKLTEPFDGKPSEALAAGYCPGCRGTGRVIRFVPVEDEYPCSTCEGTGAAMTGQHEDAYQEGRSVGENMAQRRAAGGFDGYLRAELAEAAKRPAPYFAEFKRGLTDGLDRVRQPDA